MPWRDLAWGRPPWRAAGHLSAGPAGGRGSSGWGSTGAPRQHHRRVQGPALRPQARPALTWKRSRAPGGAEKPRVRVYCGGRRAAAAGAQRRAPAPGRHRCGEPRAASTGPRAVRGPPRRRDCVGPARKWGGGVTARALCCCPPKAFAWPLAPSEHGSGQEAAVGGCASTRAGVSFSSGGPRAGCVNGSVPLLIAVSIPCCGPGVAAACVWILPMARGKVLLLASPCEAFPSFCGPTDVLWLSCSLGLVAGTYCHCGCDPSPVWSHQSPGCPQPQRSCRLSPPSCPPSPVLLPPAF